MYSREIQLALARGYNGSKSWCETGVLGTTEWSPIDRRYHWSGGVLKHFNDLGTGDWRALAQNWGPWRQLMSGAKIQIRCTIEEVLIDFKLRTMKPSLVETHSQQWV